MVGASGSRSSNEVILVLAGKFLEGFALRFGDEEGRKDTSEHEEGEDLKDMRNERILASSVLEFEGDDLWKEIGKGEMSLTFWELKIQPRRRT